MHLMLAVYVALDYDKQPSFCKEEFKKHVFVSEN